MNTPRSPQSKVKEPIFELAKLNCKTSQTFGRIYHPKGGWGGGRRRILENREHVASYHLMSRTVGGDFLLSDAEDKQGLKVLMWRLSEFLFVRVQTYCIMDNHFHVLVQLPCLSKVLKKFQPREGETIPRPVEDSDTLGNRGVKTELAPWESRLIQHLSTFYSEQYIKKLTEEIKWMRSLEQEKQIKEMLDRYLERFCCVSHFMKELKERYSRWYNKKYGRKGTLWMDRFKSVLVEDAEAKIMMAAYIDLNPVRAGLVKDPQNYQWCGYAEAQGGSRRARRGLCRAMGYPLNSWTDSGAVYRTWLFNRGSELVEGGKVIRRGVDQDEAERVYSAKGRQPIHVLLRQRISYFTTGLVIGTRSYLRALGLG